MDQQHSPFDYRPFRYFFTAKLGSTVAQMMMVMVIGWQVYDIARLTLPIAQSALLLGLIGLAQFLPVFFLSLVVGVVADRVDRRYIARASVALEFCCALGLALFSASGSTMLWPLFTVAVLLGVARAFASPALTALAPNLVPLAILPSAIAWNSIGFQIGAVSGPVIGGLAYDFGPPLPYGMAAALLLLSLVALFLIPPIPLPKASGKSGLQSVRDGLLYVRGNQIVLGAISLDLFAVILAGTNAMLPIYARDILDVGAAQLGWMRGAPAIGAAMVALWLTRNPIGHHVGMKMFVNVGLYALATMAFGFSTNLWVSIASLVLLGGADMISVYVRQSLIQLHTPDAMRGRVSSVSGLFVSASNELGEFRAGLMAAAIGPIAATVGGGFVALLITILWARLFPVLRDADTLDVPEGMEGAIQPGGPPAAG